MDEMIELFSLGKVHKAGARYDFEKAKWFNHQYVKATDDLKLAQAIKPQVEAKGFVYEENYVKEFCRLMKERAHFTNELLELGYYFFEDIKLYDTETLSKKYSKEKRAAIEGVLNAMKEVNEFNAPSIEKAIKEYLQQNNLKIGEVMPVLRLALAGTMQGPAVFDMAALLGKEKTISRINKSLDFFETV
jgi:glutamyl-tRNA synthetase